MAMPGCVPFSDMILWSISLVALTHRLIGDPGVFAVCQDTGDLSTICMAMVDEEHDAYPVNLGVSNMEHPKC